MIKSPKNKVKKFTIVANWKNTPNSLVEAKKNFRTILSKKIDTKKMDVVICPSILHLSEMAKGYKGKNFKFGSQNVCVKNERPFTGEIDVEQLVDLKIGYSIVGHAERRELGEDNLLVAKKVATLIEKGITPILCVGEIERDERGEYLRFVERQLVESLSAISENKLGKVIVAYEPVWAMGAGKKSVGTHEIHQMVIFIKKILVSKFDKKTAMNVNILYGGSVDSDNVVDILNNSEVDGLLIGRASANPFSFVDILKKIS